MNLFLGLIMIASLLASIYLYWSSSRPINDTWSVIERNRNK